LSGKKPKRRLDLILQENYPELSRSRLQAEIMAGRVKVDGIVIDKPGTPVSESAKVEISASDNPYVSRGGLKLKGALDKLNINVSGLIVLDVGASTGGFTDCLLQMGAKKVYALDVGYGQLDYKLRSDPRVISMERFNIRHLKQKDLSETPDLAVADVSFISLAHVMPVLASVGILEVLALVKPQFEVGKAEADRGSGVIRDPVLHRDVIGGAIANASAAGYFCTDITFSPKPGPKGNLEYFIYLKSESPDSAENCDCTNLIRDVVIEAHLKLQK
jgi:23S rRNA (cytidine1920-2'-O)/16S rRNA (cytidine1409-2'-O)-methyltransferase